MLTKRQILNELKDIIKIDAESETAKSYWKGYRDALCYVLRESPQKFKFQWEGKLNE